MWHTRSHPKKKRNGLWVMFIQIVLGGHWDAGGSPEDIDCNGRGGWNLQPLHVLDCCGDHPAGVFDLVVGYRLHMGHSCLSTQGRRRVSWNRPGGCALESNLYHNWPTFGGLHRIPWHSEQLQSLERDRDIQLGGQKPPTDFGPAAGGLVGYLCGYPQDLWCARLGECPGGIGTVHGGPPNISDTTVSPREAHFPLRSSILLMKRFQATGLVWWQRMRPSLKELGTWWKRSQYYSTWIAALLLPPNMCGYSGPLTC